MSLYISRLKDLVFKTFHLENDWLYYIKHSETQRLENGTFVDINKDILKKMPYIYEILPTIKKLHDTYNHISLKNLNKKFLQT